MTTPSTGNLSHYTATAVAAYGALSTDDFLNKLVKGDSNFTDSQAQAFTGQFELIHQQPNTFLNGFSATVFKESGGTHVLAIRGTEMEGWQIFEDLLKEDIFTISVAGFAANQAVELYRYYRQLTTMPGQPVQYSTAEVLQLLWLKQSVLPVVTQASLLADLATDRGVTPASGAMSLPVLSPTEKIVVTGHSLGGHLALLFARLFPQNTAEVISLNAPGIFHHGILRLSMAGFSADPLIS